MVPNFYWVGSQRWFREELSRHFDIFSHFFNVSGIPQSDNYASKSAGYYLDISSSLYARKRAQESIDVSWNSRKSKWLKLQYNNCKRGIFSCPWSYCYIKLYPSDDSWTLWHVSWASWDISWAYYMVSWTWLNINISIKRSPGNHLICPGNVSGGPGNVS